MTPDAMDQPNVSSVESGYRARHGLDPTPWVSVTLLLALAAFLRFYRLDDQLWLDEIASLTGAYRKPFLEILTTFSGWQHPLYDLLARASLVLLGESALAIRLPAAIFGVGGVLIFYRLARRLSGRGESLLAGALMAVSYHHIFFSQNARGYSAYLFFALATTDVFLELLETMRWRTALAYVGLAAMTVYTHPFGLFVPAGHMLVGLPVAWSRQRAGDRTTPTPAQLLGIAVLTNLAILVLYAPFIRDGIVFSLTTGRTAGPAPRVFALVPELLEGLRAAFHGWSGVILAGAIGAIGAVDYLRRRPVAVAALAFPLLVAAAAVGLLGVGVRPRYFLLALPLGYLAGTRGLVVVARTVLEGGLRLPAERTARLRGALAVFVVLLAAVPLIRYYGYPKQDYLGALQTVRALAIKGDRVVAADLAGHAIQAYYAPDYPVIEDLTDLLGEEAGGRRVWVVTTLERVMAKRDPKFLAYLHRHYRLVRVLPGSLGDGAMRIYMREAVRSQASNGPIFD